MLSEEDCGELVGGTQEHTYTLTVHQKRDEIKITRYINIFCARLGQVLDKDILAESFRLFNLPDVTLLFSLREVVEGGPVVDNDYHYAPPD